MQRRGREGVGAEGEREDQDKVQETGHVGVRSWLNVGGESNACGVVRRRVELQAGRALTMLILCDSVCTAAESTQDCQSRQILHLTMLVWEQGAELLGPFHTFYSSAQRED